MKFLRVKRSRLEILSEKQEIFDFISQFLDIQIFLKTIKCLSREFNISIQKVFLQLHSRNVNLSLQNINLSYFNWQLIKFKNRIHSIKLFHTMNDSFLKCLIKNCSNIQYLDLSYCREIKNVYPLKKLHSLVFLNIKGFPISESNFKILKVIKYLFTRKSLKKVMMSKRVENLIQLLILKNQLYDFQSIFDYY